MDGGEAKGTKTFVDKSKGRRSQEKSAIWEENIKMNLIYMCLNLAGSWQDIGAQPVTKLWVP